MNIGKNEFETTLIFFYELRMVAQAHRYALKKGFAKKVKP